MILNKIKLLSVIETLGKGGAEQVLVNTLPELQKQGIECEVVILFEIDDLAEKLEANEIKVHRLYLSYKWNIIEGIYKLYRLIKDNDYDIVHAHLFFAYFYTGLMKFFNLKIKTVTTFHNLGYNTYPANTLLKKVRKKLDEWVVNKLIDKKTAVSNEVKKHFEEHLYIKNVDLIFNSFPLEYIKSFKEVNQDEILKQYVDTSLFGIYSITPGRLVKEKGHKYLLKALHKLPKDLKLCHFIVGSGPLKNEIVSKIKEYDLKNVILIPSLNQENLFQLIQASDMAVIPSISEGFPMIIGECMALQKHIIATKISGITDMIENKKDGILVPSKNHLALAKAIEKLSRDKQMQLFFEKNAYKKVQKFDTKIIAQQWKMYYEEMLNE